MFNSKALVLVIFWLMLTYRRKAVPSILVYCIIKTVANYCIILYLEYYLWKIIDIANDDRDNSIRVKRVNTMIT